MYLSTQSVHKLWVLTRMLCTNIFFVWCVYNFLPCPPSQDIWADAWALVYRVVFLNICWVHIVFVSIKDHLFLCDLCLVQGQMAGHTGIEI